MSASAFKSINGSASGNLALREARDMAALNDEMWGQTLAVLKEFRTALQTLEARVGALEAQLAPKVTIEYSHE